MVFVFPALIGLWLFLQLTALVFLLGGWRQAALVPAGAMAAAVAFGVLGAMAGGSMAPMWIVLAFPLCLFWLALLWLARGASALLAR